MFRAWNRFHHRLWLTIPFDTGNPEYRIDESTAATRRIFRRDGRLQINVVDASKDEVTSSGAEFEHNVAAPEKTEFPRCFTGEIRPDG